MQKVNPYVILIASLLVGLGPWIQSADTWGSLFSTSNLGPGIGIVGGVLLAWVGRSPQKPKI